MSNIICKLDLQITSLKDSADLIIGVSSIQVLNYHFENYSGIHFAIWDDGQLNDCGEWIVRCPGTEILEGDQLSTFWINDKGIMAFENIERKECEI